MLSYKKIERLADVVLEHTYDSKSGAYDVLMVSAVEFARAIEKEVREEERARCLRILQELQEQVKKHFAGFRRDLLALLEKGETP